MKKIAVFFLLFFCLFFFIFHITAAKAGNIMGSSISWTCLGKDSFLVKIVVYRDCNGDKLAAFPVHFRCNSSGWDTFTTMNISWGIDITPLYINSCTRCQNPNCAFPYGIEEYTCRSMVFLKSVPVTCCEINIYASIGTRNSSITTGAADQNFYTEAMVNRCISPAVSSPQFSNKPMAIVCLGQDFTICCCVSMPPGSLIDSLGYSWAPPLQDAGSGSSWNPPYDYNRPVYFYGFPDTNLPIPQGLHLDPHTGIIRFRPLKIEQTVMAVKISQFRNHVKIAENRLDFQIIVMNCASNHPPVIYSPVYYKEICPGDTASFTINTDDIDPADTVRIDWDKTITGAKWTDNNGKCQHPTANFSWISPKLSSKSTPYTFTVSAYDNFCQFQGNSFQDFQVFVKPIPEATTKITNSSSGHYYFQSIVTKGKNPKITWSGVGFTFLPDTGVITNHLFRHTGSYPWSVTITAEGCSQTYYDTLQVLSVSIDQNSLKLDNNIFPNPVTGISILKTNYTGSKVLKVIFYNSAGEKIKEGFLKNSEFEIRKTDFGKGAFFYRLIEGEKMINSGSLIIE